jgi:cyclophilin family peptidyl-prolyl cis-trans isomerase/HEAT repeat protein
MMKLSVFLLIAMAVSLLSCSQPDQKVLHEMRSLEYMRIANSDKFIVWLNDHDHHIRKYAIRTLGRIQDPKSIPWVARCLSDKSSEVRSEAAFALGQFFNEEAESPLINSIKNETAEEVRLKLTEALGKVGTVRSHPILNDLAKSKSSELIRILAISSGLLAYRGYPPYGLVPLFSEIVGSSTDADIKWRSAYALYRIGTPISFKDILDYANRVDSISLFFILRYQNQILNFLSSSQYREFQNHKFIKEVFETVNSDMFLDFLTYTLKDSAWFIRMATLQIMENLSSQKIFDRINPFIYDKHPHVRRAAIQALGKINNPKAIAFLKRRMENSGDWRERGLILNELADLEPAFIIDVIKNQIDNLKWPENYYHLSALGKIKNKEATSILIKIAATTNLSQLNNVLELLAERDNVSHSIFIDKLKLNDPIITAIVAQIVGVYKEENAVLPLIESCQKFKMPIDLTPMLEVISALDSIGSPKAVNFLEDQLQNPALPVRKAAAQVLNKITKQTYKFDEFSQLPLTKHDFPRVSPKSRPMVKFKTTKGDFKIELFPDKAPVTVANFISLINSEFYNDIYFHRVEPGFVCQTGDPRGDGWGGARYRIPCEYNSVFYDRGTVGMAHAGKDTGSSQFFISYMPLPHLNGHHTAFGKVVSGMKVIDRIEVFDKILKVSVLD